MKFNTEEIQRVADSLNTIFVPFKEVYNKAKQMTNDAGDNPMAETLYSHFQIMERSFNASVRVSFENLKKDLQANVDNIAEFQRIMNGVADPSTSATDSIAQKRHTAQFTAV